MWSGVPRRLHFCFHASHRNQTTLTIAMCFSAQLDLVLRSQFLRISPSLPLHPNFKFQHLVHMLEGADLNRSHFSIQQGVRKMPKVVVARKFWQAPVYAPMSSPYFSALDRSFPIHSVLRSARDRLRIHLRTPQAQNTPRNSHFPPQI